MHRYLHRCKYPLLAICGLWGHYVGLCKTACESIDTFFNIELIYDLHKAEVDLSIEIEGTQFFNALYCHLVCIGERDELSS